MENRATYKRVKINWWLILPMSGLYVWMIFSLNNGFVSKSSLIFAGISYIVFFLYVGRFKVIIDDNFVVFRSDVPNYMTKIPMTDISLVKIKIFSIFGYRSSIWRPVEIPIVDIKNVSVERVGLMKMGDEEKNVTKTYFDFVKQAISIQMKNDEIYMIAIKDAEKIKEEIENRINNNK